MSHPSPTAPQSAAQEVGAATTRPAAPPAHARAHPRSASLRLGERRDRGLGELLLLIGVAVVAGPPVAALAGALVLLAFALSGPYLLVPILSLAFALVAFVAMGASG